MLVVRPPTNYQQRRNCWGCWGNVGRHNTNYGLASILRVLGVLVGRRIARYDRLPFMRARPQHPQPTNIGAATSPLCEPNAMKRILKILEIVAPQERWATTFRLCTGIR